jgi:hypothetical protein
VRAWAGTEDSPNRWFRLDGANLTPRFTVPDEDADTFADMTREFVDYRLAQYRRRSDAKEIGASFDCKLTWNQRDPILKLPSRIKRPDLPRGETDVRLPDGRVWRFRFVKEYCNVAHAPGSARNELPDLLRGWFGPGAGKPGTGFHVHFSPSPDGWWVEPMGQVIELPRRGAVAAFPSLSQSLSSSAFCAFWDGVTVSTISAQHDWGPE